MFSMLPFNRKTNFVAIVYFLFCAGILSCESPKNQVEQPKSEEEQLAYFLSLADSIRQMAKVPGVGIALVKKNKVVYTGGLGFSNLSQKTPVNENTLFSIGSNTKAFTGALAAILVAENQMDWNAPLKSYIPEFTLQEPYVTKHATLRDALNHLTGLGRHDSIWLYKEFPRDRILEKIKNLDFASSFRSSFGYNNLMYTVAGIAMERATNDRWENLIQSRLLTPLNMSNSFTTQEQFEAAPNRAIGYKEDGETPDRVVYLNHIAPAGSISSTPNDISHWIAMLVNEGEFQGKRVLSKKQYGLLMRPQENIGLRPPNQFWYYNAGIGGYMEAGKRNVGHNGSIDGQDSSMMLLPDDGFAVFLISNKNSNYNPLIAGYAKNIFVQNNYKRDFAAEKALKDEANFVLFAKKLQNGSIAAAKALYHTLDSKNLEGPMNILGYQLMGNGELEKARFVFEQNIQDHVDSSNAFDSMGEFFFTIKAYDSALINYQKSFDLDTKNTNAKMMIEKIKEKIKALE